ncbi:MAG: HipA domain-containing protein [Saprospiraceae bacterium]|nr:HipA domain-containing protein [Saprospiraceae bacterium]
MKRPGRKIEIWVFAHWKPLSEPVLMGRLQSELLRGKEVFSFEYDETWLRSEYGQQLDPDLRLYSGKQYLTDDKPNFGLFLDSSPDRWGRVLMRRREAAMARKERRQEEPLFETDYLLGVYDEYRMGALRFKLELDGPFLNDDRDMASPPWTSIRTLEEISLLLENDEGADDPDYIKWLGVLMAPGSSLGGARPKASILDTNNHLWIAKFPSQNDQTDIGGWEMVAHELARQAGLNVSQAMARKFSSRHHTFLTKRFDRTPNGRRVHFASAMTLLGYKDGQNYQDGVSYLDLVEFLMTYGAKIEQDLKELWRRIVFSICVSNTDDHLRNHGFLLTPQGWVLSPAYDINPVEKGTGLSLHVTETDNALSLDLPMEVFEYFRLREKEALLIIEEVKRAVRNWKAVASEYGLPKAEQSLKSQAFSEAGG